MATPRVEEYLEAIFKIQEKTRHPVNISRLAEYLGLSVPSASEMLKKLAQSGVVTYNQQREISLSAEGLRAAASVVRRHRLSERLLTDILGMSWDEVHEEACRLEHAISPLVEEHLAKRLGDPETCPHGHLIPDPFGKLPPQTSIPLAEVQEGSRARIVMVSEEDPELLKYLDNLALRPGVELLVEEIAPFGGPITISVGKARHALGPQLAQKVFVEPLA